MEANMPGDPKECRQHALNCVQLAKTAELPEARDSFAHLARTWIRLAEAHASGTRRRRRGTRAGTDGLKKGADRSRRPSL